MPYAPDPVDDLYIIEPGGEDDSWGTLLNTNLKRIAESIHDKVGHTFVGGETSYTLDDTDFTGTESHKALLNTSGNPGNDVTVIVPAKPHIWHCYNDVVGHKVTIKTSVPGAAFIDLLEGERAILFVVAESGGVYSIFRSSELLKIGGSPTMTSDLNMSDHHINNVAYPTIFGRQAATTDWVQTVVTALIIQNNVTILNLIFPIGTIHISATNPNNPVTYFGFGSWIPYGGGTYLACVGTHTDTTGFTTTLGAAEAPAFGDYRTILQQTHLPPTLSIQANTNDTVSGFAHLTSAAGGGQGGSVNVPVGGGTPFSNMPPLSAVYVWRRVA